jgi:hypothetical protein
MRTIMTTLLLAAIWSTASAQTVARIEIVEYGIFSAQVTERPAISGAVAGVGDTLSDVRLVETTKTIPARLGVEFGFRYKIYGQPNGAEIQLKKITLVPQPGLRNPNTGNTLVRGEIVYTEKIGVTRYKGYHFDDPWELVPGTWTFELWQGDRKLASQEFNVVK